MIDDGQADCPRTRHAKFTPIPILGILQLLDRAAHDVLEDDQARIRRDHHPLGSQGAV